MKNNSQQFTTRVLFSCISMFLLNLSVFSQQNTFSLNQAKEYAKLNSIKSKGALIEIEKANLKVKETRAIGLPQVNGEVSFQNFIDLPTSVIPANAFSPSAPADLLVPVKFGTDFNTSAQITASQLIFDGSYIVGLQAAKKYKNYALAQKNKTDLEIKESVSKAYLMVLVAQENVSILKQSLIQTTKIYEDMKIYFQNELIEEQDVDQLKVSVSDIKTRINQAERQLSNAKNMLKYEMGLDLNAEIDLTDSISTFVNSIDLANFQDSKESFNQNLDYQLLEEQKTLSELNVKLEKSKYLPSLGAFFNHQQQNLVNKLNFSTWYPATIWGLKLSVPIWSSGRQGAVLKQRKLDLENLSNQMDLMADGLKLQIQNAQDNVSSAKEIFDTEKESLDLTLKIKNNTEIKYKEGVSSSMDLTQAQNQFLMKEGQYIQAMFNLVNTKIDLEKLLNKL